MYQGRSQRAVQLNVNIKMHETAAQKSCANRRVTNPSSSAHLPPASTAMPSATQGRCHPRDPASHSANRDARPITLNEQLNHTLAEIRVHETEVAQIDFRAQQGQMQEGDGERRLRSREEIAALGELQRKLLY